MTTLLTGAGGFLGSHVLSRLLTHTDDQIICIDSFTHNGTTDAIADVLDDYGVSRRVTVMPHDLTVPFSERRIQQLKRVDRIIDCASLCQVDQSIRSPLDFIRNNIAVTLTVLELARHLEVEHMVHISTDEVHGADQNHGHQPSSPYAASKAAQDDICHAYLMTYAAPITLVRSCNMFGERQSQLAFLPRLIRAAMNGDPIQVHVGNDGTPGGRWYNYVGNVAAFVVSESVRRSLDFEQNLAGQQYIDNIELVQRVGELTGKMIETSRIRGQSVRPGYDKQYQKLVKIPDWEPGVDIDEAFKRTVTWFTERPAWLDLP